MTTTNSTSDEREGAETEMSKEADRKQVAQKLRTVFYGLKMPTVEEIVNRLMLEYVTTIRQEERAAERKRVLGVIKRVPATAAGADAFRRRIIEELYVEAAANETKGEAKGG